MATLLHYGHTIQSTFCLPVPMLEGKRCGIRPNDPEAETIRTTSLFILDETSMICRPALEAIDAMRDVCGIDVPFAGKMFLLGRDFRQTLPIVVGGGRAESVGQLYNTLPYVAIVHHLQFVPQHACKGQSRPLL